MKFDNVLARPGSSFCYRARLNFQAFSLRDMKWRQEKAVALVKRWAIALVFANQTVLALEEAIISMCQSSRVKMLISIAKLDDRCFCYVTAAMFVSLRRTRTWRLHTKLCKFGWHTSANSAWMENSRGLILGEVQRFILQSYNISQTLEFIYWEVTVLVLIKWLVKIENTFMKWSQCTVCFTDLVAWKAHLIKDKGIVHVLEYWFIHSSNTSKKTRYAKKLKNKSVIYVNSFEHLNLTNFQNWSSLVKPRQSFVLTPT